MMMMRVSALLIVLLAVAAQAATEEPSQAPSVSSAPTYSEDWSYRCGYYQGLGSLQDDNCYSFDSYYCTWYKYGCTDIESDMEYYNINDFSDVYTNRTYYGWAKILISSCEDGSVNMCTLKVGGEGIGETTCACSVSGTEVTLDSCPSLPTGSINATIGQTIAAEGGTLDIESTTEMCEHPTVVALNGADTDSATERNFNLNIPSKGESIASATKTIMFPAELDIWVHEDQGVSAFDLDIDTSVQTQLLAKSMEFIMSILSTDPNYAGLVSDVFFDEIEVSAVSEEQMEAEFKIHVKVPSTVDSNLRQLLEGVAAGNWNNYITFFRQASPNSPAASNVLQKIRKVVFKGFGRGGVSDGDEENE